MAAAAIPFVIAGLSALGGLFGNRKKTTTQTQHGTQVTDATRTTTPTYDPAALAMRNALMNSFMSRISPGYAQELASDITTGNIQNINRGWASSQRVLQEALGARGLGYSPVSAVLGAEANDRRIGNVVQALNQRRLLADQMQRENLAGASGFFERLPVGSTVTDKGTVTTDMTGTSTDPGNMLGGLFGGLGTSLAGMYGGTYGFGKYAPNWGSILRNAGNFGKGDYGNPPAWSTNDYGDPWSENPATMGTQGWLMSPQSMVSNMLLNRSQPSWARILGNLGGANLLQGGLLGAFLRR